MDPKIFKRVLSDDPSENEYKFWRKMLDVYISKAEVPNESRLEVLFVLCGVQSFGIIEDCTSFDSALQRLDNKFVKKTSAIMLRHKLRTSRQKEGQSIEEYLAELKALARKCPSSALTADQYKDLLISDAFVSGVLSPSIRQRLLESTDDSLENLIKTALTMELASEDAKGLTSHSQPTQFLASATTDNNLHLANPTSVAAARQSQNKKCFWCGGAIHPRNTCPAKESICNNCHRRGHWASACKAKSTQSRHPRNASVKTADELHHIDDESESSNCASLYHLAAITPSKGLIKIHINGHQTEALLDTGADKTFVTANLLAKFRVPFRKSKEQHVLLADETKIKILGKCQLEMEWDSRYYSPEVLVVPSLVAPVVLGLDVLKQHESLTLNFAGSKDAISVCMALQSISCTKYDLLPGVDTTKLKPIATSSRPNRNHTSFVNSEVTRMLQEDIIQESRSPWRAQSFVVKRDNKLRLVVDYSQTINKFTALDAYPMPRINDIVQNVASNSVFTTIDMKEAYHQIPLKTKDFQLTAFEASGRLYEFKRLPFGCTNAVPIFQRTINDFIEKNRLARTYAYLDDIIIGGRTQEEHDRNLHSFMEASRKHGLQFNSSKCKFSRRSIEFLGHLIENGAMKPDPKRYESLLQLPTPSSLKQLNYVIGLFAYYAKWIRRCSDLSTLLTEARASIEQNGLSKDAKQAFEQMKHELVNSSLYTPDLSQPMTIETDASDHGLGGVLSQNGRPAAFFSRSLSVGEKQQPIIEKEAGAIVECCRRWRDLIKAAPYCTILTDQRSVAYLFNKTHANKIKNEKLLRWRLELSDLHIVTSYRPGSENVAADAMSRCLSLSSDTRLKDAHVRLCHPGVTRLHHYCRTHNLPFSLHDIRNLVSNCPVCCELKPKFFKPPSGSLICATQPWQRLSIDFVGPLANSGGSRYLLTIVDEFSRYPFAYPCRDMSTDTVIHSLLDLFALFGSPSAIHSDRGSQFESAKFKHFLLSNGVVRTRTTAYHPQGNGQCERTNGTLCKAIALALKCEGLEKNHWTKVLPRALSSLRGLLCTSTNCTPHDRLFKFARSSKFGAELPNFLTQPGSTILHRNHIHLKGDPVAEKVHLIETISPHHARIQFPDGRNSTVSTTNLASYPNPGRDSVSITGDETLYSPSIEEPEVEPGPADSPPPSLVSPNQNSESMPEKNNVREPSNSPVLPSREAANTLTRSSRVVSRPRYLEDYDLS